MKPARIWLAAAVAAAGLKLFTYEYYLRDDPTSGIAARLRPALANREALRQGDLVLVRDENRFVGASLYEAMVNWGYLAVLGAGPVLWYARRGRRRTPKIVIGRQ